MRPSARFLLDKERAWISRLVATNSPVWHESHVSQTHDLGDCNCLQNNFLSPKSLRWRWWQTASPWILSWLAHTDWQQRLAIFEFLMRLYGLLNLSFNVNQNSSANRTKLSGSVIMKKLTWELSDVEKKYCGAQNLWWLFFQPLLFNTSVSFSKAFLFFFFFYPTKTLARENSRHFATPPQFLEKWHFGRKRMETKCRLRLTSRFLLAKQKDFVRVIIPLQVRR